LRFEVFRRRRTRPMEVTGGGEVRGSEFRVPGSGFRVPGSGFSKFDFLMS
jgi:hypothetical protein